MSDGASPESAALPHIKIGSDTVYQDENRLMIHATSTMDWPIREFCRVPIYVLDHKYYLRSKRTGDTRHAAIYELWPWPDNLFESAKTTVVYDLAYVEERNRSAVVKNSEDVAYYLLLPLYPLLGLCWSGFKNGILRRIGFEPRSITNLSIFLTFNLFFMQAIYSGWLGGGFLTYLVGLKGFRAVDWVLLTTLAIDTVLRFSQSLRTDVQRSWGFCEWMWPPAWRQDEKF